MNRMNSIYMFLLVTVFAAFSACNSLVEMPDPVTFESKIVLNANLVAGEPVDSVKLNIAADIEGVYDYRTTALSGALVLLMYEDRVDTLYEDEFEPGIYHHPDSTFTVTPGVTYTIEASDSLSHLPAIKASTTVPPELVIYEMDPMISHGDTIQYIPAGEDAQFLYPLLYSFKVRTANGEPFPPIIRLVNSAMDARRETMITEDDTLKALLFKWNLRGDEDPEDIEKRIKLNSSISFNSVDSAAVYDMGWIFFTFYGPQLLTVYALDQAYYDYHIRFLEGPPTDPNYLLTSNVEGGYGLLTSSTKANGTALLYYLSRPD